MLRLDFPEGFRGSRILRLTPFSPIGWGSSAHVGSGPLAAGFNFRQSDIAPKGLEATADQPLLPSVFRGLRALSGDAFPQKRVTCYWSVTSRVTG